jgi:hypothetical protein
MQKTLLELEPDSSSRSLPLFRRGTAAAFFYVSLLLNVILWFLLALFIGIGDGIVVLRYNAYFGVDLTGSSWQVFLVPFMTTLFFVVNTLMAFIFVRKGALFSGTLLMVASFFIHVAALIAIRALILVN